MIVDAALEASGAPIHELDGALGLDGGNCRIHILWHHISWAKVYIQFESREFKLKQKTQKKTWCMLVLGKGRGRIVSITETNCMEAHAVHLTGLRNKGRKLG